jgi:hypothetical protein
LFVDPGKNDYLLRPESPALAMGSKPFDFTKAGVYPWFCPDLRLKHWCQNGAIFGLIAAAMAVSCPREDTRQKKRRQCSPRESPIP